MNSKIEIKAIPVLMIQDNNMLELNLFNSNNHHECRPEKINYNEYVNRFNFENWYKGLVDAELIEISPQIRKDLERISIIRVLTGRRLKETDLEDISPSFLENITCILAKFDNEVFVKTSEKSAKNDHPLKPLHTLKDVIEEITGSMEILKYSIAHEYVQCKFLVLKKWESKITESNEFRVIVQDNRILGISQQRWYKNVGLTHQMCLDAAYSIINWYNHVKIPYDSTVLDVWVDFSERPHQTHLIECNPGFCWGSSGSALFHWIDSKEILQSNIIQVRYVSDMCPKTECILRV